MSTINTLFEQKGNIVKQMRELTLKADKESRALSPEESVSFDKMDADLVAIDGTLERMERAKKLDTIEAPVLEKQDTAPSIEVATRKAWQDYLVRGERTSEKSLALIEKRGTAEQVVGTAGLGGYTVPTLLSNQLIEAMKAYGGVLSLVNIVDSPTGATYTMPKIDTTAQTGALITETTADSVQDLAFTTVSLGAYMFTSNIVKMSWEFLQDNIVGAEARLYDILAKRIGRSLAAYFTTGTGSAQPEGFVVGAGAAAVTTASATAVTYAEIVDFIYSLDDAYKPNARLMFNNTTLKALRKFVDSTGRPLYDFDARSAFPDTINGIPFTIVHEMADYGTATNKFMAYGDLKQAFYVRRVMGDTLTVFREKYGDQRLNGYMLNSRWDSAVIEAPAIKIMAHHA